MRTADPLASKRMVIGLGAQKAGSSWLYSQLARHPGVYMSPIKELHYFDSFFETSLFPRFNSLLQGELNAARTSSTGPIDAQRVRCLEDRIRMTSDLESYKDYFRKRVSERHSVFGEITPSYAALGDDGLAAIRDCHEDVGVLFIMRDPIDRLISAMSIYQRRAGRTAPSSAIVAGLEKPNVAARCRYDLTLQRIERIFEPDQTFLWFYETMFTPAFSGALGDFLGLEEIRMNFDERPNASPGEAMVDLELISQLRELLAPVYEFCRERFGKRVPDSWRL